MAYLTDGMIGVDLTVTPSTQVFTLGTRRTGTDGTVNASHG